LFAPSERSRSAFIFGLGLLLFSRIEGPVAFFLTFFMMAVGTSLGGYLPISVAIVTWFRRRRSLALSISGMGMALGGLLTPIVMTSLSRFGWRWTAFASGIVVLVVALPLAQLMRHPPERYGLTPDGEPRQADDAAVRPMETRSFGARAIFRRSHISSATRRLSSSRSWCT
jgi:sugar phosphate permease